MRIAQGLSIAFLLLLARIAHWRTPGFLRNSTCSWYTHLDFCRNILAGSSTPVGVSCAAARTDLYSSRSAERGKCKCRGINLFGFTIFTDDLHMSRRGLHVCLYLHHRRGQHATSYQGQWDIV
ncbi:hypothetical protein F5X98DRAFT_38142 [Xylaria grammica]|nr:hypothetical protein F5X98DRAFT_38142 [Xylaria grammica]